MTKIFLFLLLRPAATLAGPTQASTSAASNQSEPRLQFFQIGGARKKLPPFPPFRFLLGKISEQKKVFSSAAITFFARGPFFLSRARFLPLKVRGGTTAH